MIHNRFPSLTHWKRDTIRASVQCLVGAVLFAFGVIIQVIKCVVVLHVCLGHSICVIGGYVAISAVTIWAYRLAFSLLCRAPSLPNLLYTVLLLHDHLGRVVAAVTVFILWAEILHDSHSTIHKLLVLLIITNCTFTLQRIMLINIENTYVIENYSVKIRDSITDQAVFRAMYNYCAKQSELQKKLFPERWSVYTMHKILESDLWTSSEHGSQDLWFTNTENRQHHHHHHYQTDLFDMLLQKVSESHARGVEPVKPHGLRRVSGTINVTTASKSPHTLEQAITTIRPEELIKTVPDSLHGPLQEMFKSVKVITRPVFHKALKTAADGRLALQLTLGDYTRIVKKLNNGITVLTLNVLLFIALTVFGIDVNKTGVTYITFLIGLSFIFGDTAKRFFEGAVMVFVWSPFAVHDRIFTKDDYGQQANLIVKRINLLTTEFISSDGQVTIISNSSLQGREIRNATRSGATSTVLTCKISANTQSRIVGDLLTHLEHHRMAMDQEVTAVNVSLTTARDDGLTSTVLVTLHHATSFENNASRFEIQDSFCRCIHDFLSQQAESPTTTCAAAVVNQNQ